MGFPCSSFRTAARRVTSTLASYVFERRQPASGNVAATRTKARMFVVEVLRTETRWLFDMVAALSEHDGDGHDDERERSADVLRPLEDRLGAALVEDEPDPGRQHVEEEAAV